MFEFGCVALEEDFFLTKFSLCFFTFQSIGEDAFPIYDAAHADVIDSLGTIFIGSIVDLGCLTSL